MSTRLSAEYPVACFGETYFHADGTISGGTPVHMAYHLQKNFVRAAVLSRIGLDNRGKLLMRFMETQGFCCEYIQVDYECETGAAPPFFTLKDETGIPDVAAWQRIVPEPCLLELVAGSQYFIFNQRCVYPKTIAQTLVTLAAAAKRKVFQVAGNIVMFDHQLVAGLLMNAYVLQITRYQLELLTGIFNKNLLVNERMQLLQDEFHIPHVIVLNPDYTILYNADGSELLQINPSSPARNDPAFLDAFLAGLLYMLSINSPPQDALVFGAAAAGVASAFTEEFADYTREDILQYLTIQRNQQQA